MAGYFYTSEDTLEKVLAPEYKLDHWFQSGRRYYNWVLLEDGGRVEFPHEPSADDNYLNSAVAYNDMIGYSNIGYIYHIDSSTDYIDYIEIGRSDGKELTVTDISKVKALLIPQKTIALSDGKEYSRALLLLPDNSLVEFSGFTFPN